MNSRPDILYVNKYIRLHKLIYKKAVVRTYSLRTFTMARENVYSTSPDTRRCPGSMENMFEYWPRFARHPVKTLQGGKCLNTCLASLGIPESHINTRFDLQMTSEVTSLGGPINKKLIGGPLVPKNLPRFARHPRKP